MTVGARLAAARPHRLQMPPARAPTPDCRTPVTHISRVLVLGRDAYVDLIPPALICLWLSRRHILTLVKPGHAQACDEGETGQLPVRYLRAVAPQLCPATRCRGSRPRSTRSVSSSRSLAPVGGNHCAEACSTGRRSQTRGQVLTRQGAWRLRSRSYTCAEAAPDMTLPTGSVPTVNRHQRCPAPHPWGVLGAICGREQHRSRRSTLCLG